MNSTQFVLETFKNTLSSHINTMKEHNVMVAGGVFTSAFSKTQVNDIDCYFRSERDLINFVAYLAEDHGFLRCTSFTDKSLTFVSDDVQLQLIYFKYFEDLHHVFKSFDFTINMCGWDSATDELVYNENFFPDLAARRLSFNKDTDYPLVSALRIQKYVSRGFSISRSETIKVMLAVADIKIDTLEDFVAQVGGMYGNSVMHYLDQMQGEFSVEKAMNALAKAEVSSTLQIGDKDLSHAPSESVDMRVALSALINKDKFLDGGWYVDPSNTKFAKYKTVNGRSDSIPVSIAYMFAKDKQVTQKEGEDKNVVLYKWVTKDDNGVLCSIYKNNFKYPYSGVVEDAGKGMFMLQHHEVEDHYFKDKSSHLIVATAKVSDLSKSGNQILSKKINVIFAIPREQVNYANLSETNLVGFNADSDGYSIDNTSHEMYISISDLFEEKEDEVAPSFIPITAVNVVDDRI